MRSLISKFCRFREETPKTSELFYSIVHKYYRLSNKLIPAKNLCPLKLNAARPQVPKLISLERLSRQAGQLFSVRTFPVETSDIFIVNISFRKSRRIKKGTAKSCPVEAHQSPHRTRKQCPICQKQGDTDCNAFLCV